MALVSQEIPGFYNGVSQQPPSLRLSTQVEEMENCLPSLVDGLVRRPNSAHVQRMTGSTATPSSFYHTINRDANEKYILIVTEELNSPIEIWTLAGEKCVVDYGNLDDNLNFTRDHNIKWYFMHHYPKGVFKAVTIADYTLLVNTTVVTSMFPHYDSGQRYEVIVWVKQHQPKVAWYMGAGGRSSSYPETENQKPTYAVASALANVRGGNMTCDQLNSLIRIRERYNAKFGFSITDGWGERNHSAIVHGEANKFTDLPPYCWGGTKVRIVNDDSGSAMGDYYVHFVDQGGGSGVWKETRGWGLLNLIHPNLMPHRIVRMPGGWFAVATCNWNERLVGDEDSAPTPSFIGRPISNLFFFKNRLGIIAGDTVCMSEASEFFNFWPTTVMEVLDSDPIDISIASSDVPKLRFAKPFEQNLILLGESSQFALSSGGQTLTPKTVVVDPITTFEVSKDCEPEASGSNLFFLSPSQVHSRMREYFVQPDSLMTDAADVTSHVPNYLGWGPAKIAACAALDMVFVHFNFQPNTIYFYKFYWQGNEKPQSSWSKWVFPYNILNIAVFDTRLFLIADGIEQDLEVIYLENIKHWGKLRFALDKMVAVTGAYNSSLNRTTWVLPYADFGGNLVVQWPNGQVVPGPYTRASEYHIAATGNYSSHWALIGYPFTSRVRLSEWAIKTQDGKQAMNGVLQHKWMSLVYDNTGYFRVEVTPKGRTKHSRVVAPAWTPDIHGNTENMPGGEQRFIINTAASNATIDIVSDSTLPMSIQKGTHEGVFVKRAQSI